MLARAGGVTHDLVVREPGQQLVQDDARFSAGEAGAEAEVLSEAERDLGRIRIAAYVELVAPLPGVFVAVGRRI